MIYYVGGGLGELIFVNIFSIVILSTSCLFTRSSLISVKLILPIKKKKKNLKSYTAMEGYERPIAKFKIFF